MQSFLVTVASMLVGGGLAAATIFGVVSSQVNPTDASNASVTVPVIDYGSTN